LSSGACTGSERGSLAKHPISPGADRNRKRWSGDEGPKPHRLMLLWNGVKFMLLQDAMDESAFGAVESGTSDGSTQFCR
jgi:hypothetical protein